RQRRLPDAPLAGEEQVTRGVFDELHSVGSVGMGWGQMVPLSPLNLKTLRPSAPGTHRLTWGQIATGRWVMEKSLGQFDPSHPRWLLLRWRKEINNTHFRRSTNRRFRRSAAVGGPTCRVARPVLRGSGSRPRWPGPRPP